MASSSLYLCIDCGGTKAAAVIANDKGEIVGRGRGGPSNFKDVDLSTFTNSVRTAVEAALANIDLSTVHLEDRAPNTRSAFTGWFKSSSKSHSPSSKPTHRRKTSGTCVHRSPITLPSQRPLFRAAWIGVAGVDRPQDIMDLTPVLSKLFSISPGPNLRIENDTCLLASPLSRHSDVNTAVVAISGTGSIVVSFEENPDGGLQALGRAGGWGWLLGDEGSGYYIGREALRRILDVSDQESASPSSSASPSPIQTKAPSLGSPHIAISADDSPSSQSSSLSVPSLQDRIFEHFGIHSAPDIFTVVYAPDPPRFNDAKISPNGRPSAAYLAQERKARLTTLTPIVFQSALKDHDPLAVDILQSSAQHAARLIGRSISPAVAGGPIATESVLCFGGSLVGVPEYRDMVVDHLARMGHVFRYVEFVDDAATSGALRLVSLFGGV